MFNIETLGKKRNAVILQIAIAHFEPSTGRIYSTFQVDVEYANSQRDRSIDTDTLEWWMSQSQEVREVVFAKDGRIALSLVMRKMSNYLFACQEVISNRQVWANGIDFDFAIIESAIEDSSIDSQWWHNRKNDLRTLVNNCPNNETVRKGMANDAINDVINQIERLVVPYNKLQK
jgi:hypothetical protein